MAAVGNGGGVVGGSRRRRAENRFCRAGLAILARSTEKLFFAREWDSRGTLDSRANSQSATMTACELRRAVPCCGSPVVVGGGRRRMVIWRQIGPRSHHLPRRLSSLGSKYREERSIPREFCRWRDGDLRSGCAVVVSLRVLVVVVERRRGGDCVARTVRTSSELFILRAGPE